MVEKFDLQPAGWSKKYSVALSVDLANQAN